MGFGRMTAKAEIPPVNGNQINVLPGRGQSVSGAFNSDPGSGRAIAFMGQVDPNRDARALDLLTSARSNSFVSCIPLNCMRTINNSNRIARSDETFLLSLSPLFVLPSLLSGQFQAGRNETFQKWR